MGIFDTAWNSVTGVADAATDVVGDIASSTGDVIGAVGGVANAATGGAAGELLELVDDTVLDGVDELTRGVIDVDFDDGDFSVRAGVDGVASVGASVGDDGIRHRGSVIGAGYDVSASDDGLAVAGQAGIDLGPLPYVEIDAAVDADGDVALDTRAQGTVPTPWGVVSGRTEVDFEQDENGWAGRVDAEGSIRLANGGIVGGGVDVAYAENEDGSSLSVGVEGSYSQPGLGTVGAGVGYERLERGDVVIDGLHVEAHAEGLGGRMSASADRVSVTTPEGTVTDWSTEVDASGPDFAAVGAAVGASLGSADLGRVAGGLVDGALDGSTAPTATSATPTAADGAVMIPTVDGGATATSIPDTGGPAPTGAAPVGVASTEAAPAPPLAPAAAPDTPVEIAVTPEPTPDPAFHDALEAADGAQTAVDGLFDDLDL